MDARINTCFVLITSLMFFFTFAHENESFKCDHSFGNSSWNYSHTYYNETHVLKARTQELAVVLPRNDGEMISFICVRAPSLTNETHAAFASITSTVTVTARAPVERDADVNIVAKIHGY